MPKGVRKSRFELPAKLKLEYVKGEPFVKLKALAKLAGIPAPVIEMAERLLKTPDDEGGVFLLASQEMKDAAPQIESMFVDGLTRMAKCFGQKGTKVKSFRDDDRIVCYYQLHKLRSAGPGKRAKA
jgi:hypothetical protein